MRTGAEKLCFTLSVYSFKGNLAVLQGLYWVRFKNRCFPDVFWEYTMGTLT